MLLMAACLPLTLSTLPGQPTHRSCLLGYGALVLIANNTSADSRIHRIKQESASLLLERRLQTPQRHHPRRDSPCTLSLSMMQKPVYPPTYAERAVFSVSSNASDCKDSALGIEHECTTLCAFVSRRLLRLETLPKALVQAFLTSDDITLMDRYACSAVVYNEELTTKRQLRLIRDELKQLLGKYPI
jgi:hypothetical protein